MAREPRRCPWRSSTGPTGERLGQRGLREGVSGSRGGSRTGNAFVPILLPVPPSLSTITLPARPRHLTSSPQLIQVEHLAYDEHSEMSLLWWRKAGYWAGSQMNMATLLSSKNPLAERCPEDLGTEHTCKWGSPGTGKARVGLGAGPGLLSPPEASGSRWEEILKGGEVTKVRTQGKTSLTQPLAPTAGSMPVTVHI